MQFEGSCPQSYMAKETILRLAATKVMIMVKNGPLINMIAHRCEAKFEDIENKVVEPFILVMTCQPYRAIRDLQRGEHIPVTKICDRHKLDCLLSQTDDLGNTWLQLWKDRCIDGEGEQWLRKRILDKQKEMRRLSKRGEPMTCPTNGTRPHYGRASSSSSAAGGGTVIVKAQNTRRTLLKVSTRKNTMTVQEVKQKMAKKGYTDPWTCNPYAVAAPRLPGAVTINEREVPDNTMVCLYEYWRRMGDEELVVPNSILETNAVRSGSTPPYRCHRSLTPRLSG